MKRLFIALIFLSHLAFAQDLKIPSELKTNYTVTYQECIDFYQKLDEKFSTVNILSIGESDTYYPLHLVVIDKNGYKDPSKIRSKNRNIILINNGIHPGEPEGIDASMMWARDLVAKPEFFKLLDHTSFIIIPVYNIGGCLRRNRHSRANQNGPESYGFRANRNNLDLNRDFVKQESKNARSFAIMFQFWKPDVFMDTHTTDGADYQYNMSLLPGMRSKMPKLIGDFLYEKMLPYLYHSMKNENDEMVPYVEFEDRPENGVYAFNDRARFGSGYAALFHCLPFVIESHMLKPFNVRLESTYRIIKYISIYTSTNCNIILENKKKAIQNSMAEKNYAILWKKDLNKSQNLNFKGFTSNYKFYPILNDSLFYYDTKSPLTLSVPYYEYFTSTQSINKPKYYIIPSCYNEVIDNLKRNGVLMKQLMNDTSINCSISKIKSYKSLNNPYENHYLHYNVELENQKELSKFLKGDFLISTNQDAVLYIMETLEPEAEDSYFNWNFFDGVLMRKEYFSDYVFAPEAEKLLQTDIKLNQQFQEYLNADSIPKSMSDKLDFIYKKSKNAESSYSVYPVGRIE